MLLNKRLLLVLDDQDPACLALQRGHLIATRLHSPVSIVWLGDDVVKAGQAVAQLEADGIAVTLYHCARHKLLKQLSELLLQQPVGLLIKSCDPRTLGFMTSIDGHILRDLPCPVLLIKEQRLWQGGVVMAAVNALTDDPQQIQLNDDLMRVAAQIAVVTESALTAAVAYPSAMMGADPVLQSEHLIQAKAEQALAAQLRRLALTVQAMAVGEGPAEHWLPLAAQQLQARLTVIGTRARGGLKGALIGNTAERILTRLEGDILVLRIGLADEVVPLLNQ
ncbi:universal stress protein [Amphritea sp. 1_MG-2023]|uniref:universal stress protein n=1 Tax=Amphritea sp. 1_MG-2023 TaxID=3062670 RepID=UPI0026E28D3B|nr:universal stress protein [Amphritea sp. 1_MG-2023]MDO6564900.1 universal stress protein [Amphritea sp. 1_MG-2023]